MSKTTASLLIILLLFLCILLFIVFGMKENPIINSFEKTFPPKTTLSDTSLSLSTETQTLQPGQTATIAVLIHNINPHTDIAELSLAYDPNVLTIDSVMPGAFFTKPTIAFQTIDSVAGRISYALRCPATQTSMAMIDCNNPSSVTLATVTVSVNPYTQQNSTTLTFLPKTVIRIKDGRDVLKNASRLNLTIGRSYTATASGEKIPVLPIITVTPFR